MSQEFIIGKSPASSIKVPADRLGVSGRHAKITITDSGKWELLDLDSTNGTFIREDNGEFTRISSRSITECDVIRLGAKGADSFTFMAHRVTEPGDSYGYEFRQLRRKQAELAERASKLEKRISTVGWISKCSGIAAFVIITYIAKFTGIDIDPNVRYMVIAMAPPIVGLFFAGDAKAVKALRKIREKLLVCPKCNRPISDYDIEEGQCSRCKAK